MILNFTPQGGYKDAENSAALDKGKGRTEDLTGSLSTEPCTGPSCHLEQDKGNQTSFIPSLEANETPIVVENVDKANAAMDTDTMPPCSSHDAGGIVAIPDANTCPGAEVGQQKVVKQRGRKKNKVTKNESKASVPEMSVTLVHGDCVVLSGDDFEVSVALPLGAYDPI